MSVALIVGGVIAQFFGAIFFAIGYEKPGDQNSAAFFVGAAYLFFAPFFFYIAGGWP